MNVLLFDILDQSLKTNQRLLQLLREQEEQHAKPQNQETKRLIGHLK